MFAPKIKSAALMVVLFLLGASTLPVAAAQEDSPSDVPPTMVILDASGSMLAEDAGGETRMDAAKQATHEFLGGVSPGSELGFMTYGTGTSNDPSEQEAGCRDVTTLSPVESGQIDSIRSGVDDIEASGYTPMGPALRQAADELPDDGERGIVLISDGIDTCAPPPVCEVAQELADQGIDLVINTVGFLVDDEARAELECIAEVGGGQYMNASDADSLAESMRILYTREVRGYESDLPEYVGSENESQPTEVPADVDAFSTPIKDLGNALAGPNAEEQYWSIPVEEGERVALSMVTAQPPAAGGFVTDRVLMSFKFADHSCREADWREAEILAAQGVISAAAISTIMGDECEPEDGNLVFSIERGGGFMEGMDIPAEITIERFAGEDLSEVPEPLESDTNTGTDEDIEIQAGSEPQAVTPGTWFSDATEISADGATTMSADIVPGESHFYKINADYGQNVVGELSPGGYDGDTSLRMGSDDLDVDMFNRVRQPMMVGATGRVPDGDPQTFGFTTPLNYRNAVDATTQEELWLDGEQYIVVHFAPWGGDNEEVGGIEQATASYDLTVEVQGEPQPGPTFTQAAAPTTQTAEAEDTTEPAEPVVTDEAQGSNDSDGTNWTMIGVIVVGVLVLIALIGGVLFASRRNNTG